MFRSIPKLARWLLLAVAGALFTLTPAASIAGSILTSTALAVEGAHVFAVNQNGLRTAERMTHADAQGRFEFRDLAAGGYNVWASGADFRTLIERANVEIGGRADLLLQAQPAASLRAKIELAGRPCRTGEVVLSGPVEVSQAIEGPQ